MNRITEARLRGMATDNSPTVKAMATELIELRAQVADLERRLASPIKLPPKMNVKMGGDKQSKALFGGINMGINDCAKVLMELGFNVAGYPVKED